MAPLPSAPAPTTWPQRTSSQVWANDLEVQLTQAVRFLTRPPALYARQLTTTQAVANSTDQEITLDTILYDNYGAMNDANNRRYLVPAGCGGVWLGLGGVPFNAGSTTSNFQGKFSLNAGATLINGASYPSATSATVASEVYDLLFLNAGDRVALDAFQNTGVSQNLVNGPERAPYLNLVWVANSTGTNGLTPPNPRTWATNDACVSTGGGGNFNTEIYNAVSFLSFVPFCRVVQGSNQSVATGADTHLTGLTASAGQDNYNAYNAGTDTWTAPVAGTYLVGAQVAFTNASGASYFVEVQAKLNGVTTTFRLGTATGQADTRVTGMKTFRCLAGDTMQLFGRQNAAGALNTSAASTRMFVLWRSS